MGQVDVASFRAELGRFSRSERDRTGHDPAFQLDWHVPTAEWQVTARARDGRRYLIHAIPFGALDAVADGVIAGLYDATPLREGGAAALNRLLDARQEADAEAARRRRRSDLQALHAEGFDTLMRRSGLRINNAGVPNGSGPGGFTVIDRRHSAPTQEVPHGEEVEAQEAAAPVLGAAPTAPVSEAESASGPTT